MHCHRFWFVFTICVQSVHLLMLSYNIFFWIIVRQNIFSQCMQYLNMFVWSKTCDICVLSSFKRCILVMPYIFLLYHCGKFLCDDPVMLNNFLFHSRLTTSQKGIMNEPFPALHKITVDNQPILALFINLCYFLITLLIISINRDVNIECWWCGL